jgi:hypothetical protein
MLALIKRKRKLYFVEAHRVLQSNGSETMRYDA